MKKESVKLMLNILLVILSLNLSAQNEEFEVVSSDWIDQGLTIGLDVSKYMYGEVGYHRSLVYEVQGFPFNSMLMNYGAEFSYFDKLVVAPKIQGRVHLFLFNVSLTTLCYTDFEQYAVKVRPEIGVGLWNIDINYGYNIGIYKGGFKRYNKHILMLRYYLKFKRKYLNEYDMYGNKKSLN